MAEDLPSNAGDLGSIPGWGTKISLASRQLRLRALATEPVNSRAHVPQLEKPPRAASRESLVPQQRPSTAKKKEKKYSMRANWRNSQAGNLLIFDLFPWFLSHGKILP